jgi:hypothetical protein
VTTPSRSPIHLQKGATLVVSLLMLILITLLVTSAYVMSTSNLKSVGNMQFRQEAIYAANIAIEDRLSSNFDATLLNSTSSVDIDQNGIDDYTVNLTYTCKRTWPAGATGETSLDLPSIAGTAWYALINIAANVADTATGASVVVNSGVRIWLPDVATRNVVCP